MPLQTNYEEHYLVRRNEVKADGITIPSGTYDETSIRAFTEYRETDPDVYQWKSKLKRGEPVFTYLKGEKYRVRNRPGVAFRSLQWVPTFGPQGPVEDVSSQGSLYLYLSLGSGGDPADQAATLAKADSLALTAFIAAARKKQTAFSGGTFLAELRDTLRALRDPAKTLRQGISNYYYGTLRRLRRMKGQSAVHRTRLIRDSWLEYSFGWAPLVSDIEGACKAIRRMSTSYSNPVYLQIKSPRLQPEQHVYEDVPGIENHPADSRLSWEFRVLRWYWATVQYNGFVGLEVDAAGYRIAEQNFGWAPQDFLPSLWEAVPYSFLVDYFTNIGDVISALSFSTAALRDVWKTTRTGYGVRAYDARLLPHGLTPVGGVWVTLGEHFVPGTHQREVTSVVRAPYFGSYVPPLGVRIPGMGTKWLNIAALANLRAFKL